MTPHRFYCPSLACGEVSLPPEEARHAAQVLRLQIGDSTELFNGCGQTATGPIVRCDKKNVSVQVDRLENQPRPTGPTLVLHTALPRQPRQPFLFEKATELGVDAINPVRFERSTVKAQSGSISKWRRTCIEAGKQSRAAYLPVIGTPGDFADALPLDQAEIRLVADPVDTCISLRAQIERLTGAATTTPKISIWIGPEGGFSDDERDRFQAAGVHPVSLGPQILRIETAVIAAATVVLIR